MDLAAHAELIQAALFGTMILVAALNVYILTLHKRGGSSEPARWAVFALVRWLAQKLPGSRRINSHLNGHGAVT